ncbi:unnamed protein product [Diabrotica balteata]|uniref:C2H2-type domain-containing protein n=1 Tax=Diabrotica balteata TaxID=107213 RepID=A0A9P0E0H4_DIABA|nr:unnamed protein product [Diabrotica balteata]
MEKNKEVINICGFCLKRTSTDSVTEVFLDMIQIVIPDVLPYLNKVAVCENCDRLVKSIFNFKSTCLEIEDNIYSYKTNNSKELDLEDLVGLRENDFYKQSRICRTCFKMVEDDMCLLVDKNNDSLLQLHQKKCLPELNMELTKQPVLCADCVDMLRKYFNFVTRCIGNVDHKKNLLKIDKIEAGNDLTKITKYELIIADDIKIENEKDLPNEEYRLHSSICIKDDIQELFLSDINNDCQVPENTNEIVVISNDISNIDISQSNELEQNADKVISEDVISISDSNEDTVEYNLKEICGDHSHNSKELFELRNKQTDNNGAILQRNHSTTVSTHTEYTVNFNFQDKGGNSDSQQLCEAKNTNTDDNQPALECTAIEISDEDTVEYNLQEIKENSVIRELSKPENICTDNNKHTLECTSSTIVDKSTLKDNQTTMDSVIDKKTDDENTKLVSKFNQIFNNSVQIDSKNTGQEVTKNYSDNGGHDDVETDLECVRNVSTVTSQQAETNLNQSSVLKNNNLKQTKSPSKNVDANDKTDNGDKNLEIEFSSDEDISRYANDIEEIIDDLSLDEDSNIDNALTKSNTLNKEKIIEISNTCDSDIQCDIEAVHTNSSEIVHSKYDSDIEIIGLAETQKESHSQNKNSDSQYNVGNRRSNRKSKTKRKLSDLSPESSPDQNHNNDSDFEVNSDNESSDSEEYSEINKRFKMSNKYLYCGYCRYRATSTMRMDEHLNKCKKFQSVKIQEHPKNKKSTSNTSLNSTIVAAPTSGVTSQQNATYSMFLGQTLLYLIQKSHIIVGETSSSYSPSVNKTNVIDFRSNKTAEKQQSQESSNVIIVSDDEKSIEPVDTLNEGSNNLVIINENDNVNEELTTQLDVDPLAVDIENVRATILKDHHYFLPPETDIENEFRSVNVQTGSGNEAEPLPDSNINIVSNLLLNPGQTINNAIGLMSVGKDDSLKNGENNDTEIPKVAPAEGKTHDAENSKITTDTEINSVIKELESVLEDSSIISESTKNTNNLNKDLYSQNNVVPDKIVTAVCHPMTEINQGSKSNSNNCSGDLGKLSMPETSIEKDKVVGEDHTVTNIQIQKTSESSELQLIRKPAGSRAVATTKRWVVLDDHLVDQKILTVYKCNSCDFNTRYLKVIDLHILDHFCQIANGKYACNVCLAQFSDKLNMIEHVKELQHGYKIGVWCVNCSSVFLKTWEARKHQKVCKRKQISVKLFKSNNVIFCMLCQYETSDLAQAKEHTKKCKERLMKARHVIELD